MTVYAVRYTYIDESERVGAIRPAHRAWLAERLAAGELLASGPFAGGAGALLVLRAASRDELDALVAQDPYRAGGVLAAVEVHEWQQVFGPWTDQS